MAETYKRVRQIGLYFGSFNPVHVGHLAIANYLVEFTSLDEVWFIISPHNPLKSKSSLLNDRLRYELVKVAIEDSTTLRASDVEFNMPRPSYTIDTLAYLTEKYPDIEFSIIMGSDGLRTFGKWKNAELIVSNYKRIIYPRHSEETEWIKTHRNIEIVDAPRIEISSSFIRQSIKEGKDIRYFLHPKVFDLIDRYGYYKN